MRLSAAVCFIIVQVCMMANTENDDARMFDDLFPPTVYKKALNTLMLIWEDIRIFNSNRSGLDNQTWHDLLIGRLIRLKKYCKKLELHQILADESAYLITLLHTLVHEYKGKNKKVHSLALSILSKLTDYR